jgi:hypothetical protein
LGSFTFLLSYLPTHPRAQGELGGDLFMCTLLYLPTSKPGGYYMEGGL